MRRGLLLLLLLAPVCGGPPRNRDRAFRGRARECETSPPCAEIQPPELRANCVHECVSPRCYAQIYGDEPLEDGEVDAKRERAFTLCARREMHRVRADQLDDNARRGRKKHGGEKMSSEGL
mmetsp:Transcript_36722/g.117810  ORF Transcript_36722/g.117810 Transcript_36722/m.117810 type:complete len:121 (+) Transcript_36722:334-696(+)